MKMKKIKNVDPVFYNFKPRFGVHNFVHYNLKALLANFPKDSSKQKACILKRKNCFVFSIVVYSHGKIFQSHAEIPIFKCQKWSRPWQKGIIEKLSSDIIKQNHMWRNLKHQMIT